MHDRDGEHSKILRTQWHSQNGTTRGWAHSRSYSMAGGFASLLVTALLTVACSDAASTTGQPRKKGREKEPHSSPQDPSKEVFEADQFQSTTKNAVGWDGRSLTGTKTIAVFAVE